VNQTAVNLALSCTALLALLWSSTAQAQDRDCWIAGNFLGLSANSFDDYAFSDDALRDGMLVCFTRDGGNVSGNDLPLIRMGPSTLIGWSSNELGLETVNTYQLARGRRKLLVTQSRIGTATVTTALPDYTAAFVADVVPAP
jgi:hypothetical protein